MKELRKEREKREEAPMAGGSPTSQVGIVRPALYTFILDTKGSKPDTRRYRT